MADLLSSIRTGERRWRIGLINGPNMLHLEKRERAIISELEAGEDIRAVDQAASYETMLSQQ